MNEVHFYEEVGSAVEDSVKIILSNLIQVTDLIGEQSYKGRCGELNHTCLCITNLEKVFAL